MASKAYKPARATGQDPATSKPGHAGLIQRMVWLGAALLVLAFGLSIWLAGLIWLLRHEDSPPADPCRACTTAQPSCKTEASTQP